MPLKAPPETRRITAWLVRVALVFGGVWVLLFAIHAALPGIRPGADLIYEAKVNYLKSGEVYPPGPGVHVAIFGNSKALSGFQPELFDSLSGGQTRSYNAGLPNWTAFVDNLEMLCTRGKAPGIALVQWIWPDTTPPSAIDTAFDAVFHPPIEDGNWMETLFPFRTLPRNAFLFTLRARSRGGMVEYYRDTQRQLDMMMSQRGYYFIEGQSHFPGDRLPDDFHLASDKPQIVASRDGRVDVPEFKRIKTLAERYDIRIILVPTYYRQGEAAPPPAQNQLMATRLATQARIALIGPDYFLLPNSLFSDMTHLNPTGAAEYTKRLWSLIEPELHSMGQRAKGG